MPNFKVVKSPYICTIPRGGLQSIKCYPDAITFFSNGKKYGFSKKTGTIIAPLDASLSDAIKAHEQYLKHL